MFPFGPMSARFRYDVLLPLAARSRRFGAVYAGLCGRAELAADGGRARVAIERLQRWTGVPEAKAREAFRRSLSSEAQEEADSAFFQAHPEALDRWLPGSVDIPRPSGPVVYATLHFGHPVLSCVFLQRCGGIDVRPIIRGLDDANPMADPKRGWGQRKVSWVRDLLDDGVFGVDAVSTARAREHLLGDGAVFAALDVPGDVSDRTSTVSVAGEHLRFSAGIVSLARMTGSTIVPVVARSGRDAMVVEFGRPVSAGVEDPFAVVFSELSGFIQRHPEEWWLWPFLNPA